MLSALVLLAAALPQARAHEDPVGDVHPTVSVKDRHFVVTFFCNSAIQTDFSQKNVGKFQTTIGLDGSPIETRTPVAMLTFYEYGDATNVGDSEEAWIFNAWRQRMLPPDGKKLPLFPQERIVWPGHFIFDIGASATPYHSKLFCHISSGMEMTLQEEVPLYLAAIDPLTGLVWTVKLGFPVRIYGFAAASEIRIIEGQAYIAWVWNGALRHLSISEEELRAKKDISGVWQSDRDEKRYYRVVHRLVLSRWNLATDQLEHFFLPDRIDWNTSLSMNAIGDKLLIAWHVGIPASTPNAKIMTRFIDTAKLCANQSQRTPSLDFDPQILPKFP